MTNKQDSVKLNKEDILNINDTTSLAIYCYLKAIKEDPNLNNKTIANHFSIGIGKVIKTMSNLKKMGLIEYRFNRRENGQIESVNLILT